MTFRINYDDLFALLVPAEDLCEECDHFHVMELQDRLSEIDPGLIGFPTKSGLEVVW